MKSCVLFSIKDFQTFPETYKADMLFKANLQMHKFMTWLARADDFTQQQQEFDKILQMQQDFDKDALKPLASNAQEVVGDVVVSFNTSLDNFSRSTCMRETLPQALCGQFDSHTTAILQPVMQEIHTVLTPTVCSVSLDHKSNDELETLIRFEISAEHFTKAAGWAKNIHDDSLRIQLEIARCFIMYQKHHAIMVPLCRAKLDQVDHGAPSKPRGFASTRS